MKHLKTITRRTTLALLKTLTLTIIFGAAALAQNITPHVTCVEPDPNDSTRYNAYFGYTSAESNPVFVPSGSTDNFFAPASPETATEYFLPGIHRKIVKVGLRRTSVEAWHLLGRRAEAPFSSGLLCVGNVTYQGKLPASGAAARQYDLRFQVFDAATGGSAQSDAQTISGVTATNGVFTVQLDGDMLFPREQTGKPFYLEIAVRQGTAAFTTLTPRQHITTTPFALNAVTANTATNVSGGFVQLPLTTNAPAPAECNQTSEYGQMKVDSANGILYICVASGWKSTLLQ